MFWPRRFRRRRSCRRCWISPPVTRRRSALVEMAERAVGHPRGRRRRRRMARRCGAASGRDGDAGTGGTGPGEALADGKPAMLLVGRSYNAFPPEASQSIAQKLASMGVRVIPGDCCRRSATGRRRGTIRIMIMNAVALAKRHSNLFLLYVSNFSCTIDAFTHSFFAAEMGAKPYLMLEIDAHTADAGIQTRLEAFWDIVRNYRLRTARAKRSGFQPATVIGDGAVGRPRRARSRSISRSAREESASRRFRTTTPRP